MNTLKDMINEFTSQTFGTEIANGLCFSTCFPISILLDIKQIKNSISCGDAPKNNTTVTHVWLTLDNEGTILDPTIAQFNPNMESKYIGKLTENCNLPFFRTTGLVKKKLNLLNHMTK